MVSHCSSALFSAQTVTFILSQKQQHINEIKVLYTRQTQQRGEEQDNSDFQWTVAHRLPRLENMVSTPYGFCWMMFEFVRIFFFIIIILGFLLYRDNTLLHLLQLFVSQKLQPFSVLNFSTKKLCCFSVPHRCKLNSFALKKQEHNPDYGILGWTFFCWPNY